MPVNICWYLHASSNLAPSIALSLRAMKPQWGAMALLSVARSRPYWKTMGQTEGIKLEQEMDCPFMHWSTIPTKALPAQPAQIAYSKTGRYYQ